MYAIVGYKMSFQCSGVPLYVYFLSRMRTKASIHQHLYCLLFSSPQWPYSCSSCLSHFLQAPLLFRSLSRIKKYKYAICMLQNWTEWSCKHDLLSQTNFHWLGTSLPFAVPIDKTSFFLPHCQHSFARLQSETKIHCLISKLNSFFVSCIIGPLLFFLTRKWIKYATRYNNHTDQASRE